MTIKELYRQVNILAVSRDKPPVNYEDFFVVISALEYEGKVIRTGDKVIIDNIT